MTRHDESGFTLMETLIALGVLTVGLLSVAQMMAFGFTTMTASGEDMIARQKASEAIESVYTARDHPHRDLGPHSQRGPDSRVWMAACSSTGCGHSRLLGQTGC